jgi:hypothetical protein
VTPGPRLLLAALLALPLPAQAPPFVDAPAFGGASMFVRGVSYAGGGGAADSYYAMGYAQGDFGADRFFSRLDDLRGGDAEKAAAAARGLMDGPWAVRSRSFGALVCERGASLALTREEATSLWALRETGAWPDGGAGGVGGMEGFELRRAVGERLVMGYAGRAGAMLYGSTVRVERWALGAARCGPWGLPGQGLDGRLLDYSETQRRNFSYALDAFVGVELSGDLRLGVQTNRLTARRLGDVEEGPQYRAGAQIDMGRVARLTLEKDVNEAARLPFPAPQRSEAVSLLVRANGSVTFSVGAERRRLGGASSARYGAVVWLTGKKHHLGAGFQLGGEGTPWGAAWRVH